MKKALIMLNEKATERSLDFKFVHVFNVLMFKFLFIEIYFQAIKS